ncbi:collagen alpha-1(I) chain-like [Camarhynchus parvulus]|uniref:collagen alpha-1(I) chain-like n=1 Tax=Geospiza parvula TaxID=87175 RepID=UPI0012380BE8|nr:collagen alpha-1(I) chain-like [Camarhynchus parvulus]
MRHGGHSGINPAGGGRDTRVAPCPHARGGLSHGSVTRRGWRCPGAGCRRSALGVGRAGRWRRARGAAGARAACRVVSRRVAVSGGAGRSARSGPGFAGSRGQRRRRRQRRAARSGGLRTPRASGDVEVGVRRRRGTEPASATRPRPRPRPRAGADLPPYPAPFPSCPFPGSRAAPAAPGSAARSAAAPGPPLAAGPRGAPAAELGWGCRGLLEKGEVAEKKKFGGGIRGSPRCPAPCPGCPRRRRGRSWPPARLPASGPAGAACAAPERPRRFPGMGGEGGNVGVTSKVFLGATEPLPVPAARRGCAGSRGQGWSEPPRLPRRPGPPRQRPVVSRVTMVAAGPGAAGAAAPGEAVGSGAGGATRGGARVGGAGEPPPCAGDRAWVAAASPGRAGLPRQFGSAAGAGARGGRGSGAARHRPAMCDNSPNFIIPPFPANPPAPLRRQTGFPNPLLPQPRRGGCPPLPDTHRAAAVAPWNIPRSVPPAPKPPWGLWIGPEFGNYGLKLRRTAAPCALRSPAAGPHLGLRGDRDPSGLPSPPRSPGPAAARGLRCIPRQGRGQGGRMGKGGVTLPEVPLSGSAAPRCGDSVGTELSQLARPRCPAPAGAAAPGAGGQRRVAADGGSWRRQSGGRDNGGIVRWRRWHGSARLGAAPRASSGHCLAPLGLSAATAPCPVSPWVRGAGPVPQPRGPGAVPGCARLCSHRPLGGGGQRGLGAAGTRSVWHGGTSQGGWTVWWLQKKMGTGGNGHHAVASAGVLPTLAPGARCGTMGRSMRAGPSALPSISSSRGWEPPVARRQPRGTVAPMPGGGRAGWQCRAGLAGPVAPCAARGGRKRRRAAGKAAAGRQPRGVSQSRRVCLCTESTLSPPQPAREETPR